LKNFKKALPLTSGMFNQIDFNMKRLLILIFYIAAPILVIGQINQITYNDAQNYHPKWSLDKNFILYTSMDTSNQPALKLFDIKKDSIIDINTGKKGDHYANWIAGTKRILFDCEDESGKPSIWEFNLENMQTKKIIGDQICFHPCPLHDGRKIAYTSFKTGNPDIFVLDLNTNKIEQLTFNQDTDHHPIWLIDGKKIIFESDSAGNFDIYECDIIEKKIKPLIVTPEFDGHVCLSPDERYLAYSHGPAGMRNIVIKNLHNGREYFITKEYDNSWPDWSSDNKIVFVSNREGNMNLYMIDISDLLKEIE